MSRFLRGAVVAASCFAVSASAASAHQGNPSFRSVIQSIAPHVPGLQLRVIGFDNQFDLINKTGKTVVIYGYNGEPYARVLPDGTVQENTKSPATYLNEDRFGTTPVPKQANPKAPPQWKTLDKTNEFQWHDHRMHWMAQGTTPPAVHDKNKKTKVFDYRIPIAVGGQKADVNGTLFWVGQPSGFSIFLVISLVVLVVGGAVLVVVVRRRRARAQDGGDGPPSTSGPPPSGPPADKPKEPVAEAW